MNEKTAKGGVCFAPGKDTRFVPTGRCTVPRTCIFGRGGKGECYFAGECEYREKSDEQAD